MSVEILTPTAEHWPEMAAADARAFVMEPTPESLEVQASLRELERFRIALDGSDLVGVAGSFAKELTLPGGATVPLTAVTWVSVAVTHRRRGILTRLMDAIHADGVARDEPVAGLIASEAPIYGRFGYGVGTRVAASTIDRRRAQIRTEHQPPPGSVRLVDAAASVDLLANRYDRYRRGQPGELSRSATWIRGQIIEWGATATTVLHDDGYAAWKVAADWRDGHPAHELTVLDVVAATDDAHAALWSTILSVDLVGPIRSVGHTAPDDPLRHLLTDPRALRTTDLNDHLWLRPVDIAACFGARAYRVEDRLVLDVDGTRWAISSDGCVETDEVADLRADTPAAGTLLLGGISASELARGRQMDARSSDVLARADAFFGWDPKPHCRTDF